MSEESIFTKIINGEISSYKIYEDENHYAFLDIFPFEKGHTLVIPKKQYETIMEMPQNEFLELMKVVKKIADSYAEKLNCGINLLQNNKKIANQDVPHVHFHIIPRKEKKTYYKSENCVKYLDNEAENYKNKLKLD